MLHGFNENICSSLHNYSNDAAELPLFYDHSNKQPTLSFKYTDKIDVFKFVVKKKDFQSFEQLRKKIFDF